MGLGEGHKRQRGIPQGCPFSMMLIALLTRPWHLLMQQHNVIPRTLADDLLITASGKEHVDDLVKANNATHRFLEDMGAKVATHKSVLFASTIGSRKTLRNIIWECSGKRIKVLNQFRDLGAHINVLNA